MRGKPKTPKTGPCATTGKTNEYQSNVYLPKGVFNMKKKSLRTYGVIAAVYLTLLFCALKYLDWRFETYVSIHGIAPW